MVALASCCWWEECLDICGLWWWYGILLLQGVIGSMVLCSHLFPGIGYFGPGQIWAIYIKHVNGKLCYGTFKKSSLQYSIALHHRATFYLLAHFCLIEVWWMPQHLWIIPVFFVPIWTVNNFPYLKDSVPRDLRSAALQFPFAFKLILSVQMCNSNLIPDTRIVHIIEVFATCVLTS